MTKEEFIDTSKEMGDVNKCMAESLFRVFDEDDSGTMDFGEFLMASNCTNMSSPKDIRIVVRYYIITSIIF